MTTALAFLFLTKIVTKPLPSLSPLQQSVLSRTRSQAALKLAPTAAAKLKAVSNSLLNGPAVNDYADVTRRAVIAAFPGTHLTDGEVNVLSAIALSDSIGTLKQQLDSMSELGETESLRLQMAMDRLSKLMTTLSNVLKKISDTADAITRNLK
jgi:hypothetical protein